EPELPPVVGGVERGSPAERAGLMAGDSIVEAGGQPIRIWQDLIAVVSPRAGEPIEMVVARDHGRVTLTVVPDARSVAAGPDGGAADSIVGRIGVETAIQRERPGTLGA